MKSTTDAFEAAVASGQFDFTVWYNFSDEEKINIADSISNKLAADRYKLPTKKMNVNSVCSEATPEGYIIDRICPITKGGRVNIYGSRFSGKSVLIDSLLKSYKAQVEQGYSFHHIYVVIVDQRAYEVCDLDRKYSSEKVSVINAQKANDVEITLAEAQVRAFAGEDILFMMDSLDSYLGFVDSDFHILCADRLYPKTYQALSKILNAGGRFENAGTFEENAGTLTTIFTMLYDDIIDPSVSKVAKIYCETEINMSAKLLREGIYPPINTLSSKFRYEDKITNSNPDDKKSFRDIEAKYGKYTPLVISAYLGDDKAKESLEQKDLKF